MHVVGIGRSVAMICNTWSIAGWRISGDEISQKSDHDKCWHHPEPHEQSAQIEYNDGGGNDQLWLIGPLQLESFGSHGELEV